MNSVPNGPSDRANYTSDSRDCVDIFYDGPGDKTRRPLTGEHRKRAEAERAKIQYWTAVERGEIDPEKTPPPPEYKAPPSS
jgi:hypothetical protein